jgi:hypothetical protein
VILLMRPHVACALVGCRNSATCHSKHLVIDHIQTLTWLWRALLAWSACSLVTRAGPRRDDPPPPATDMPPPVQASKGASNTEFKPGQALGQAELQAAGTPQHPDIILPACLT